jgi:hypothetical protein
VSSEIKRINLAKVIKSINKITKNRNEVRISSLKEETGLREYEIFVYLCSLYHNKLIEVSEPDFYKHPIDRIAFTVNLTPAGYDYLLDLGII